MYASAILSFVRQFPRECLAALVLILLAAGTALVPPMLLGSSPISVGEKLASASPQAA